jgi:NAD(P)-dependent dehydrogenase (short-subunit alcohol dehydrogenase family)
MQIKNSVFLVTGGASGLGAATARMAAENGGKVVIADMQAELGEKFARRDRRPVREMRRHVRKPTARPRWRSR